MLTASRAAWFAAAFVLALPIMLMMFRDGDPTRDVWIQSVLFAASAAAVVAIVFGRGAS